MLKNKNNYDSSNNYKWKKLFLELVVVFLGVTAGFLMNNWRMERQEEDLKQKYLSSFLQDVEKNIPDIKNMFETDSLWMERAAPLIKSIKNKNIEVDSALVLMKLIVGISKYEANTGTYEDITNSGNLNIIDDFKLKSKIVEYHSNIEGVGFIDDYFYEYFGDFVMPFVFGEFNVLSGKFRDDKIIKSVKFSNVVAGYFSMIQQRSAAYKDLLDKSYAIKDTLRNLLPGNSDK